MARTDSPAFQWYPADWIRKTRLLTPTEKGIWIDLICHMWWQDDRCSISGTVGDLARACGCMPDEFDAALKAFRMKNTCEITENSNGIVTLLSRRMQKDQKSRVSGAKRVAKLRERNNAKPDCNAPVTRKFDGSSSSSSCTTYIPPLPPEGEREGDAVHLKLVDCPQFRGMTYEQDLRARACFAGVADGLDWEAAVEAAVLAAELMAEPISNPAMFWRRQLERFVDKAGVGEKKEAAAEGRRRDVYVPLAERGDDE